MTGLSTDQPTLEHYISQLAENAHFYYIKRTNIANRIRHNNRTFYSRFEAVDKKPAIDVKLIKEKNTYITLPQSIHIPSTIINLAIIQKNC
jgi:hypothetical protein